jgi:hypothetical protein
MSTYNKKPAIVKYIGDEGQMLIPNTKIPMFTLGKTYEAYFLEYWEGERNAIHVRGNDGEIRYFVDFNNFEIVRDEDNVLNHYEAIVKCIASSSEEDDEYLETTVGKEYKAIGRDKDGYYLVMDNTYNCYFYEPCLFEIVSDPHGILREQSIYCSYFNFEQDNSDKDCYLAHKFSSNHRAELEKDRICGCFDCLRIFSPSEIEEWVPETVDGECVTAICPYCGDDSIIGESSGYPITKDFLNKMHDVWMKAV